MSILRRVSETSLRNSAKLPRNFGRRAPVPQTDTGIRDEYSKARELNLSKELGKLAPYLR